MSEKEKLLRKIFRAQMPRDFSLRDLDKLMTACGCIRFQAGRGSGIGYIHTASGRILQFDRPHPGDELHLYQVKAVRRFLKTIGYGGKT